MARGGDRVSGHSQGDESEIILRFFIKYFSPGEEGQSGQVGSGVHLGDGDGV